MSGNTDLVFSVGLAFRALMDTLKKNAPRNSKQSTLTALILVHLDKTPSIAQGDLGRRLGRDPMTMSQAIRILLDTGMVVSRPDDTDRRVKRLQLTRKGKTQSEALRKV